LHKIERRPRPPLGSIEDFQEENLLRKTFAGQAKAQVRGSVQSCSTCAVSIEKCLSVSSFHFTDLELQPADLLARLCTQMRLGCTYWACVCVHRGSAWLSQNSGMPDRIPERVFARACTIWLNCRRSTKVLFSNIYLGKIFYSHCLEMRSVKSFEYSSRIWSNTNIFVFLNSIFIQEFLYPLLVFHMEA